MTGKPNSYSGVFCLRCGDPIPVSARVIAIQDEIAQGRTGVPYAFLARCRTCEYESVYEIGSVQSIDGEPRRRITRLRAA